MARILLLTLVFSPDGVSTAALVSDLAEELKTFGHEVTVLTTQPHYNVDAVARSQQPLKPRWNGLFYQSSFHGIPVWHVTMRPKGERTLGRIFDYLVFHLISIFIGIFAISSQDVIFAVSPPLTIGMIGWLLAFFKRAKLIYNVQELYPDTAIKAGFLREGTLVVKLLRVIEQFVYNRSNALAVICPAFAEAITRKHIEQSKIHVIPNFVDIEQVQPGLKNNSLAIDLELTNKFVVLYAGNIGMLQNLDALLEAAKQMQSESNIAFLIVGDGARRSHIEQLVNEHGLDNVTLMPYQPRSHMFNIYATADLCLVPLMAGTALTAAPSKLYVIMASGRPVLVAVDANSDLVKIVNSAECGISVAPDDPVALERGIRQAYENQSLFHSFGCNGRRYTEKYLSRKSICTQYHQLIKQLISS